MLNVVITGISYIPYMSHGINYFQSYEYQYGHEQTSVSNLLRLTSWIFHITVVFRLHNRRLSIVLSWTYIYIYIYIYQYDQQWSIPVWFYSYLCSICYLDNSQTLNSNCWLALSMKNLFRLHIMIWIISIIHKIQT